MLQHSQQCEPGVMHLLLVATAADGGNNYYFAFGGCHRWAAVKQLGLPTIRARLIKVSPSAIDTYLGASSPFRKQKTTAGTATEVAGGGPDETATGGQAG